MKILSCIAIFTFLVICCPASVFSENLSPSQELKLAITIGEKFLKTLNINPNEEKLIKVENLYSRGRFVGPDIWVLTFKYRKIIPNNAHQPLGTGGEVFIEVDLKEKMAKLLGYGE